MRYAMALLLFVSGAMHSGDSVLAAPRARFGEYAGRAGGGDHHPSACNSVPTGARRPEASGRTAHLRTGRYSIGYRYGDVAPAFGFCVGKVRKRG